MELTQAQLDALVAAEEFASLAVREARRILVHAEHQQRTAQLELINYRRRMDIAERTMQVAKGIAKRRVYKVRKDGKFFLEWLRDDAMYQSNTMWTPDRIDPNRASQSGRGSGRYTRDHVEVWSEKHDERVKTVLLIKTARDHKRFIEGRLGNPVPNEHESLNQHKGFPERPRSRFQWP